MDRSLEIFNKFRQINKPILNLSSLTHENSLQQPKIQMVSLSLARAKFSNEQIYCFSLFFWSETKRASQKCKKNGIVRRKKFTWAHCVSVWPVSVIEWKIWRVFGVALIWKIPNSHVDAHDFGNMLRTDEPPERVARRKARNERVKQANREKS